MGGHGPAIQIEALAVLTEIRLALAELIAGLSKPVRRAVDLERSLGLDKKLAWQIFRVANAPDPHTEVANLPAWSSVRRLLDAARRRRVAGEVVGRLGAAFEKFESFTLVHARDRESLVSMLSGLSGGRDEQYELKVRKSLFRAAAHVWGLHCRLAVRTAILHAKPGAQFVEDGAVIQASIGLERVRVNQATEFVMAMRTVAEPPVAGAACVTPIHHPAEMLAEFCEGPLPRIVGTGGPEEGETRLSLPPGRTGAVTLYSMQLHENVTTVRQPSYFGRTLLTTPSEAMVWELLVPVGWTVPTTVRAAMYGCRAHPERVFSEQASDLMHQQETVEYLGEMERVPPLEGSARHSEAVARVLERLGWMGTRFDVYRARVQYPVMHTLLSVRADAPRDGGPG